MRVAWLLATIAGTIALAPVAAQDRGDVLGSGVATSTRANSAERAVDFAAVPPSGAALAILTTGTELPATLPIDAATRAAIADAIAANEFKGEAGDELMLRGIGGHPAVLLVGKGADSQQLREAGGKAVQALRPVKAPVALLGAGDAGAMAQAALGAGLGQYRFDRYKSDGKAPAANGLVVVGGEADAARTMWRDRHAHLAEGVRFVRDLQSEPASAIYPESFVARTRAAFAGVPGVEITVLDEAAMRKLNMGAIVGVGQGSPRGSRLMVVSYRGASGAPLVMAGKGITFDSGGISLKPNAGMWAMKADMTGAAAVMGATLSLAKSRAPVHVVAVAALAENMPGGNAQRPGDVVRTFGGQTIEIRSTDAEGRLVLADAIQYAVDRYKPFAVVDIATLTGSVGAALGEEFAGLFAREDAVADRLQAAARESGEMLWRLPLHKAYAKAIKSDIADIKNSDATGAPGASAGAHFIGHFVPETLPWAHLDIAGVDWRESDRPLEPKGASGFGVRLLDQLARDWRAP